MKSATRTCGRRSTRSSRRSACCTHRTSRPSPSATPYPSSPCSWSRQPSISCFSCTTSAWTRAHGGAGSSPRAPRRKSRGCRGLSSSFAPPSPAALRLASSWLGGRLCSPWPCPFAAASWSGAPWHPCLTLCRPGQHPSGSRKVCRATPAAVRPPRPADGRGCGVVQASPLGCSAARSLSSCSS